MLKHTHTVGGRGRSWYCRVTVGNRDRGRSLLGFSLLVMLVGKSVEEPQMGPVIWHSQIVKVEVLHRVVEAENSVAILDKAGQFLALGKKGSKVYYREW